MKVFQWARSLGAAAMVASVLTGAALVPAATAGAQSSYNGAQYQVEFSLNCVNPTAQCQTDFGFGGLWGWAALMPGGFANVQMTGCGHAGAGGGPAGAGHVSFDGMWSTFPSRTAPSPYTPTDPNGLYLSIGSNSTNGPHLPPFPATYGHYSLSYNGSVEEITIAP